MGIWDQVETEFCRCAHKDSIPTKHPCLVESNPEETYRLHPVGDACLSQIVRGHLEGDSVTDTDPDKMFTHLARYVGEYLMALRELHTEHCPCEHLRHHTFHLNHVVFGHKFEIVLLA